MTRFRRSWPWWRCVMLGLNVLALALSFYLSWHYLVDGEVIGCGGGSGCEQVLASRWSTIGGVLPVSGMAAGAYLAMLVCILFGGPSTEAAVRRLAWAAMLLIVGMAAGSAVWFTILQKWVIGAFCPYCMTAHVSGVLLAVLVLWQAPRQFEADAAGRPRFAARWLTLGLPSLGLAMAGVMATSQVIFRPPPVYLAGEAQGPVATVDPQTGPMIGPPDANYVVTLLFDYTCPHCQRMHFMLDEVVRRYDGKLAFALCPAPLDKKCNPYITRDVEEFKDSCELVKVGLAVWLAKREAFTAFENWMFTFESGDRWRPRGLDAAKAKAVELVGQEAFDTAWADPWIGDYMLTSIRIYGQTIQTGKGGVPKLVFGSRWVIPEPYSADDVISILHDSLAIPEPEYGEDG